MSKTEIQYCTRCVYPSNHPLGIAFDTEGVCTGCRVHEEKDQLDWAEREARLAKILKEYADPTGKRHDCIVPVSGGRDSFFIVDLLRHKYGLNPLLVSYNRMYNTHAGIFNLEQLRTRIGLDIVTMTMQPERIKRLTRYSLEKRGSVHWPYLAGSTVFPVQMAVKKRIPLIVWGAHQGLDQVGMFSHTHEVEMTRRYRREHDLMGLEPEDALGEDGLEEQDLAPLFYPDDRALADVGVRGIYLGNYIRWDTKAQHEAMLKRYDYYTGPQLRTFDTYNDIDCQIYSSLHDAIKFRKWGFGKISDHAAREIRFGRLTRDAAITMIDRYNNMGEGDVTGFASWLGIDVDSFWNAVDRHRDPSVWTEKNGEWILNDCVTRHGRATSASDISFIENKPARLIGDPEASQLLMRGAAA